MADVRDDRRRTQRRQAQVPALRRPPPGTGFRVIGQRSPVDTQHRRRSGQYERVARTFCPSCQACVVAGLVPAAGRSARRGQGQDIRRHRRRGRRSAQVAASLRHAGFPGSITLVHGEPSLPYQRPPLSKAYLLGRLEARKLLLRQEHWYARQRVELVSDRAVAIDRDQRQVHLAGGRLLPYDHLILATGSRNRELPVPGTHLDGVVGMRTRVDTDALASRLRGGVEVVVTGAGFIGLESAAVAAAHRASVHVLDSPTGRWRAPSPSQRRRTSAGRMIDGACGWISVRR